MKPDQLMQLATGYWPSSVLNAGVQLGVFQALPAPRTVDQLARELGLEPIYLERLLNALVGLGLLAVKKGQYGIPESLTQFLGPAAPASLEGAIRYNADLFSLWGELGSCIRNGAPVQPEGRHLGTDPEATRRFVLGMESRGKMLAPAIVDALPVPPGPRVLDLACGSGVVSCLLAQKRPALKVTLFDLPAVVDVARELWSGEGGAAEFASGNYRTDELPQGPFDFILYSGALHQESEEEAAVLFDKVYAQLAPGGLFCIVDFLLEEDMAHPVFSALFSLNMMMIQPHGHVFSCGDVESLLAGAGFRSIQSSASAAGPYGVVTAQRENS
jgi:hypothetical protein